MKKHTLNDEDRRDWISNDEGLYNWWKASRKSMTAFIKENCTEIDAAINRVLNPPKEKTWRDYAQNYGA